MTDYNIKKDIRPSAQILT